MSKILTLELNSIPAELQAIPAPPKKLYITGVDITEIMARPRVAIVGSRKVTPYGNTITSRLAGELAKQGIVIVSGLAFGVDSLAHRAALDAGGLTVAVLPSGLKNVYPSSHRVLAKEILEKGGALISEYENDDSAAYKTNFVARNRLVSGLSDAVLITEAAERSGTLHTAGFALKQGKKVLAVPGNITSTMSQGTNRLIKEGATPITSTADVLNALGLVIKSTKKVIPKSNNPNEQEILTLIYNGTSDGAELLIQSRLDVMTFNQTLTMLEIIGSIKSLGNNHWSLA